MTTGLAKFTQKTLKNSMDSIRSTGSHKRRISPRRTTYSPAHHVKDKSSPTTCCNYTPSLSTPRSMTQWTAPWRATSRHLGRHQFRRADPRHIPWRRQRETQATVTIPYVEELPPPRGTTHPVQPGESGRPSTPSTAPPVGIFKTPDSTPGVPNTPHQTNIQRSVPNTNIPADLVCQARATECVMYQRHLRTCSTRRNRTGIARATL